MKVDFINSERCKINNEELVFFLHPNTLRDKLIETVKKVGAQKFFSSPTEDIKKARESIAEYIFLLGLKKDSGQDWFLMQPKKDPPDFVLMTISAEPIIITLDHFELVEIPGRCKTFEEVLKIVQSKLNKGYVEKYHLLIFINHEKSEEWINMLHQQIQDFSPFETVWTVHLIWYKGQSGLYGSVVNRLRPYPVKHIKVAFNDKLLYKNSPLHGCLEELKIDGKKFISFRQEFVGKLTKTIRKTLLARSQCKRENNN